MTAHPEGPEGERSDENEGMPVEESLGGKGPAELRGTPVLDPIFGILAHDGVSEFVDLFVRHRKL